MQCLFINRIKKGKSDIIEKLKERDELYKKGEKVYKIVIFAEGTTNNNKGLLKFKRGAFGLKSPLKIEYLKY